VRGAGAQVEAFGEADVDLDRLLGALRARGVRFLLCEGGPSLAAQLLARRSVDELFLTHATLITAEAGARQLFVDGSPGGTVRVERRTLHEHRGEHYERSLVRYE